MASPAPPVSALASDSRAPAPQALTARNRRTAVVLVVWIVVLMLASAVVAWLRN